MRSLFILVAICFSGTAIAQSAPPKVGNKALVEVKPKAPMGCKFVGTVRGTKLWAGDCVGSELRRSTHDDQGGAASPSGSQGVERNRFPRRTKRSSNKTLPIFYIVNARRGGL